MVVHDPIYGDFDITEPVLLSLLDDPIVQRVGKVMQGATTAPINGWQDFSRLEHCIGTMLIVRTVGGSLEAQIAALLHDVSHTAFSHVVDYVYAKEGSQDHHEDIKDSIISHSYIPQILEKYGFNLERIMDDSLFPLHEMPSPDLCADRVDYALRIISYYMGRPKDALRYFKALTVYNGEIIFSNQKDALNFSEDFYYLDAEILTKARNVAAYYVFADVLKAALAKGILIEEDLLLTDELVTQKLLAGKDTGLVARFSSLNQDFAIVEDSIEPDYVMSTKARWVNPKFLETGSVLRVFDIAPELEQKVAQHRQRVKGTVAVRIAQ